MVGVTTNVTYNVIGTCACDPLVIADKSSDWSFQTESLLSSSMLRVAFSYDGAWRSLFFFPFPIWLWWPFNIVIWRMC